MKVCFLFLEPEVDVDPMIWSCVDACDLLICGNSKDRLTKFWTRSMPGDTYRNVYVGQRRPDDLEDDGTFIAFERHVS